MDIDTGVEHFKRNPKTHAKHRRESFWQITFPLLIGVLVVLAALAGVIFSAAQPVTEVQRWADVSLIWMILPTLFFVFLLLVILIGLVYGISVLIHVIPRYAAMVQYYIQWVGARVRKISNKVVEPIIKTNTTWSVIRWIGKRR